jgi:hypothetical protein
MNEYHRSKCTQRHTSCMQLNTSTRTYTLYTQHTYIHTAATIAASVGTYAASSATSSSSSTSLSGAFGVIQQAQFVAIAGKVGAGGAKSRRQGEAAQPEDNAELSGALSWINFHWIDLSGVTQCVLQDGTEL